MIDCYQNLHSLERVTCRVTIMANLLPIFWLATLVAHVAFAIACFRRRIQAGSQYRVGALYVSGGATAMSLLTFILFIRVFVVGQSSNVAQFAGEAGFHLWSLWARYWPLLLIGNLAALVLAWIAVLIPPWSWKSSLSRLAALLSVLCAGYVLLQRIPDA